MTHIPDIRAALLKGRYPFDFIRDLQGAYGLEETGPRARVIQDLLDGEEGTTALYVLMVAGTRKMLDAVATTGQNGVRRPQDLRDRLAACLGDEAKLNDLARNLSLLLGQA